MQKQKKIESLIIGCENPEDLKEKELLTESYKKEGLGVFMMPPIKELKDISSTFIKSGVSNGMRISDYVHPIIKQALEERLWEVNLIGVTGNMGSGKTTFCNKFVDYSNKNNRLKINHIEFDKLAYSVILSLYLTNSKSNQGLKEKMKMCFGEDALNEPTFNRKNIVGALFDKEKRKEILNDLRLPSVLAFNEKAKEMQGIVLVDAAYFTEYNMFPLTNYNIILVKCNKNKLFSRILKRDGMSKSEVKTKTEHQHSGTLKEEIIKKAQQSVNHGFFYEVDSTKDFDFESLTQAIKNFFPIFK